MINDNSAKKKLSKKEINDTSAKNHCSSLFLMVLCIKGINKTNKVDEPFPQL